MNPTIYVWIYTIIFITHTNGRDLRENLDEKKISYKGSQLWNTHIENRTKIKILTELRDEGDITIWSGNSTNLDILVKPTALDKLRTILEDKGLDYQIAIEDIQKAIDEENPEKYEQDDRQGHRLTWQAYHRLADIHGYLDYVAQTYPDLCTLQTIGQSIEGRSIRVLKISNNNPGNRAVWIDGGIHAREWITPATVTSIIEQFVTDFESESDAVRNVDWYIAPVLNPDGYEYTHVRDRLWRKNRNQRGGYCAGVDLNRNFGYRWGGKGSSKNPCTETYGGGGAFSEPETAALKNFITSTPAKWKAYISFHSYGQYILYPWGYDRVVPPDYQDLEKVGRKIAAAIRSVGGPSYTVGPAANTLYPASGGSDDWAKGEAGFKYAYTIELRDTGRYGFVLPASYIKPSSKEALAAVRTIAEAVNAA